MADVEHRYRYTYNNAGKRMYLHFTGMQWTPHREYAWIGTLDQLRKVVAGKGYGKIAQASARAVRHHTIKR